MKIADRIRERLQKYGVGVEVGFDKDYYYVFVRLSKNRRVSEGFIAELEAIGLVYVPGVDNWGYLAKIGKYPPFKL